MLIGVLVDVSGSMKNSLQLHVKLDEQRLTRAHSIFSTLINIVKQESGTDNTDKEIFALAFGLEDVTTCDLFALLKFAIHINTQTDGRERLIELLAKHGAPYARDYVMKYVTDAEGALICEFARGNFNIQKYVDALPPVCRNYIAHSANYGIDATTSGLSWFPLMSIVAGAKSRNEEDATRKHVESAKRELVRDKLTTMKFPDKLTLDSAISIIESIIEEPTLRNSSTDSTISKLTVEQLNRFVDNIEPYIYGGTPMCEALSYACDTFASSHHSQKVLFLLTDGAASDGNPSRYSDKFRAADVIVFVCLLTSENIANPRQLYYNPDPNWINVQRIMFELSSVVDNSHPAMALLLEQKWQLPSEGQSRLFLQANHPDVINEFSSLVQTAIEDNFTLLNIVARVSLDEYINSANSTFEPQRQIGGTCYANAVAAVFHLAMRRIVCRERGVPAFEKIRKRFIKEYGTVGASTEGVISTWCEYYRLQYKEVDEIGARQAVIARRPVLATFQLYDHQWTNFSAFYACNPTGVLERDYIGSNDAGINSEAANKLSGHAVVLIKVSPSCLTFMNSWGTRFADGGFFKVQNQAVLNLKFYDIYWTLDDLTKCEKEAFAAKRDSGWNLTDKIPLSIKNMPYECLLCHEFSPASEFVGHLLQATCPKCTQSFKPTVLGFMVEL